MVEHTTKKKYNKKNFPNEYRIWKAMRARCYAPCLKDTTYQIKKIKVCKRWDSFANFMIDMGERPKGYSIERIDNNGDYEPSNCKWIPFSEQAKNRGNFNISITYEGQTKCLKDWAKHFSIKYTTLYLRMFRKGLSFEESIKYIDPRTQKIYWEGKYYTRKELCKKYNLKLQHFYDRTSKGWTLERILKTPVVCKI